MVSDAADDVDNDVLRPGMALAIRLARDEATAVADVAEYDFEAEPTEFRCFFKRCGPDVKIRLAKAPDRSSPDTEEIVMWSGCYAVEALAKAALDGFDHAVSELGEESYESQWGRAFPRNDVEALRVAWRQITS